ncbi:hypothetical protein B0H10DRAFT_1951753 [Mycena sp. CBHHK59/15]|nr:hypothetical protein B0H10DRAFT_1951753 [Mycena sp. CBHHK59/15]
MGRQSGGEYKGSRNQLGILRVQLVQESSGDTSNQIISRGRSTPFNKFSGPFSETTRAPRRDGTSPFTVKMATVASPPKKLGKKIEALSQPRECLGSGSEARARAQAQLGKHSTGAVRRMTAVGLGLGLTGLVLMAVPKWD